jgi:hypothetical protein
VHTAGDADAKATFRPDVAVALKLKVLSPVNFVDGGAKEIV